MKGGAIEPASREGTKAHGFQKELCAFYLHGHGAKKDVRGIGNFLTAGRKGYGQKSTKDERG